MEPDTSEAAPAVLADLIAAGLVSHEMIGDPARLGGETACLRALCALVAGPVYRIDAYHYAFRAGPEDLEGQLGALAPGSWAGALEGALAETLGTESVWLNSTDLLPEAGAALAQPILLLRAQDDAVTGALEAAGPGLQAVINARYAAECARLSVGSDVGEPLHARLDSIETRQAEILERLATREEQNSVASNDDMAAMILSLSETLSVVLQRLDAQAEMMHRQVKHEGEVAEQLGELNDASATPIAFQETLGVTLAEFLARIEQQTEDSRTALRVPQFS